MSSVAAAAPFHKRENRIGARPHFASCRACLSLLLLLSCLLLSLTGWCKINPVCLNFPAALQPINLGQPMNRPTVMTELPSPVSRGIFCTTLYSVVGLGYDPHSSGTGLD